MRLSDLITKPGLNAEMVEELRVSHGHVVNHFEIHFFVVILFL